MTRFLSILLLVSSSFVHAQKSKLLTRYEKSGFTETTTYEEGIAFYKTLANQHKEITIQEIGMTDIGLPLHLVIYNTSGETDPVKIHENGKLIFLINNAIHPGEPDGVSASQLFLREIVTNKKKYKNALDKTAIAIIPFYNVGGVLNRNATTRVNQNGPEEYGFRGNARHFDLNRDFIKSDTRNSKSFQQIFHLLDPDLFLDTHVSNGADYQHVMMLLQPQKDKMGGTLGTFMNEELLPYSYEKMNDKVSTILYVNNGGSTPDKGWQQFVDWPRYSTGYTNLFHTIGFMSETHMLKNYQQRVEATYHLMHTFLAFTEEKGDRLLSIRKETKERSSEQTTFEISWTVDTTTYTELEFSGYEAEYPTSELTGKMRLKYNREKPYTKKVPYYDTFKPDLIVNAPKYYVIPQQWHKVIELFKLNRIEMNQMKTDTIIKVEAYKIADYETFTQPYEGHYRHYDVKIETSQAQISFRKGDFLVPVNQWKNRFIVETLEPHAPDSYFTWNFFDSILQQKEYFSSYIFEDTAPAILTASPALKEAFETRKKQDSSFAASGRQQLNFIYQQSVHKEKEHLRYPIFRIVGN